MTYRTLEEEIKVLELGLPPVEVRIVFPETLSFSGNSILEIALVKVLLFLIIQKHFS